MEFANAATAATKEQRVTAVSFLINIAVTPALKPIIYIVFLTLESVSGRLANC